MMGGRSWDDWIEEYAESHQHPINKLTHAFGIPMIVVSILLAPTCFFVKGFWSVPLILFVAGWVLQFIGHYFEGKPPEFFLKIGVFSSSGFAGGLRKFLGSVFSKKSV